MDFSLNETHTMIRDTARKFADERIAPGTIDRDEKEEFRARSSGSWAIWASWE